MTASPLRELFFRARRTLLDPIAWWISRRALHRQFGAADPDGIVRATDQYVGRGYYARISAMQDVREFLDFTRLVERLQPRIIVEIGTRSGGTLFALVRASRAAELVISIDLPDGRFGGGYHRRRTRLYEEFAADRPQTRMLMIRQDSHAPDTLEAVKRALDGRTIDFLFIDGDHTYDGVRSDYAMYGALVSPGGVIAFHDIRTTGREREVSTFWEELKRSVTWEEIAYKPDHLGIGVIHTRAT
jgi:cephalosporin hydroxylase